MWNFYVEFHANILCRISRGKKIHPKNSLVVRFFQYILYRSIRMWNIVFQIIIIIFHLILFPQNNIIIKNWVVYEWSDCVPLFYYNLNLEKQSLKMFIFQKNCARCPSWSVHCIFTYGIIVMKIERINEEKDGNGATPLWSFITFLLLRAHIPSWSHLIEFVEYLKTIRDRTIFDVHTRSLQNEDKQNMRECYFFLANFPVVLLRIIGYIVL